MEAGDWISIFALCLSSVSFVLAFGLERRFARANLRPVLVFVNEDANGWHLKNIGKGPALNILIAKKDDIGDWHDPVRVPPLAENADFDLAWWGELGAPEAGSVYEDFHGEVYSSTCRDDLSRVFKGCQFPTWNEGDIKRYWRYSRESSQDGMSR